MSKNRHTEDEVRFLIESGEFTAEEWADTSAPVDRGSAQLDARQGWLLGLFATKSLQEVADFLDWGEDDVRVAVAVAEGKLYAIEIYGQLRFLHGN
jgi:hypothetical protein